MHVFREKKGIEYSHADADEKLLDSLNHRDVSCLKDAA